MTAEVELSPRSRDETGVATPTIAIVINTFNHADFLGEAIASALSQTHSADDVLVVDDGSEDAPDEVVRRFPGVRLLRQQNMGLSAARNAGLDAVETDMIVFLDADDRLRPNAIEAGLECHFNNPASALVYGAYQCITGSGEPYGLPRVSQIGINAFVSLLQGNPIAMHATVMYKRDLLKQCGGYNTKMKRCEDYDVYLRLARAFPISFHSMVVAEYRKHDKNMSSNTLLMLRWALNVLDAHAAEVHGVEERQALCAGRNNWRRYYAEQILSDELWSKDPQPSLIAKLITLWRAWRASPEVANKEFRERWRRLVERLCSPLRLPRQPPRVPIGRVDFGDLARTHPIDDDFGYGRGTPLDRFYIENFLDHNREDIRGRVLEVGDDTYSRRFGETRITQQDVLHITAGNPQTTIVGDLSQAELLPRESFDCIVLTQTLHLIYEMHAAVAELHAALRRGGVLLLTVPGISRVHHYDWCDGWYWALTQASVCRLLGDVFGPTSVTVQTHGNVFAAVAFLHGCAMEDVSLDSLQESDPAYPVIVAARAVKV